MMEAIPRITPRYYSVCNFVYPKRMHNVFPGNYIPYVDVEICAAIVDYTTLYGRHRVGLASHFFKHLKPGDILGNNVWLERGFSSQLPSKIDIARKIFFVAPGTGIAPVRAIIQYIRTLPRSPATLVLTGNRNPETDFLFGSEVSSANQTIVAWSRPTQMDRSFEFAYSMYEEGGRVRGTGATRGRKTWVQDLVEIVPNIKNFLSGDILIMICGRSHPMPQQVVEGIRRVTGWTDDEIHDRIVYDTWG
jgi:sulfite reductase alpha subunit-like flavoprotein